jgi:hypothetical protein
VVVSCLVQNNKGWVRRVCISSPPLDQREALIHMNKKVTPSVFDDLKDRIMIFVDAAIGLKRIL